MKNNIFLAESESDFLDFKKPLFGLTAAAAAVKVKLVRRGVDPGYSPRHEPSSSSSSSEDYRELLLLYSSSSINGIILLFMIMLLILLS